jgi:glucan 1,3-beta-glucosidase
MWPLVALLVTTLFTTAHSNSSGTHCLVPLGAGSASPSDPYWLETITKRGTSAFNPDPDYKESAFACCVVVT